ncbi:MAG: SPOR domain-containing protein, partial [Gammaproteobacteria bacterium]|nr:SPOR domain-containing protein [Gammaproteobacteria bacterium]
RSENVERLISRYPSLGMRVQPLSNADASFRVVIGDYPSSEAAESAAEALPATLIEELGEPLVRPLTPTP